MYLVSTSAGFLSEACVWAVVKLENVRAVRCGREHDQTVLFAEARGQLMVHLRPPSGDIHINLLNLITSTINT